jgi:hypothetical protein
MYNFRFTQYFKYHTKKKAISWMAEGLEFEFGQGTEFLLLHVVQTCSGVHPTTNPMVTGDSFLGHKVAES